MKFQNIIEIANLLVIAVTALIVWIYTKAAQRSNEIQEQPLLNFYFRENPYTGGSRTGALSIKNIGKGPAYNISIEPIILQGYKYRFYLQNPMLENMEEKNPKAVVKTPTGGTEGFDSNLMWFLARLVPQRVSYEDIEYAKNNPAFFLVHYQGLNGRNYYSAFALYCNLPPVGDILMQFLTHGTGNFSTDEAKKMWLRAKKINSPFEG